MRDPQNSSEADSNHYALPLDISPVIDTVTMKVCRIDRMPTGSDNTLKETQPYKVRPPNEYISEYQKLRTDLKPLNVIQPDGTSFVVSEDGETGKRVQWQKWSFRLGFNAREGMVLYDVSGQNSHPETGFLTRVGRFATMDEACSTVWRCRT